MFGFDGGETIDQTILQLWMEGWWQLVVVIFMLFRFKKIKIWGYHPKDGLQQKEGFVKPR
jgi:hypothetical protein